MPGRALRGRIGLTGRGWSFLATGVALAVLGLASSVVPAVQFGVLVAALPLASAALTRSPRGDLVLTRTLSAMELPSGEQLKVTVSVEGRFPRGRSLLLEDLADPQLGGAHRFALNGLSGRAISRAHYRVRVGARGGHHLGPIRLHVVDRFGMVHRVATVGGRTEVLVTPRVVELDPAALAGASNGSGSAHLGALGAASDDVIPRTYVPGDEMRRIDWKASARTGLLMVRSEESPWRSAVTLVVDMRASGHRGQEPDSSLDVALSLVASVGCLALESGWDVTVRTTDDVLVFSGSPMTGVEPERRALLRALATVPVSHSPVPSTTLRHTADAAAGGPVLLVLGDVSDSSARLLAGVGAHSPERLAVLLAAQQWARPDAALAHPGRAGASAAASRSAAEAVLATAGWRIAHVERDTPVATVWSELAR